MDNAIIENNCIIAAGSVISKGMKVEEGSVYGGVPAKKIKTLSPALLKDEIERIANSYLKYASTNINGDNDEL